jgi:sterol desaturase/sphingolipid hydroxylase (fatty acid hydroxylase superfamily)
MRDWPTPPSWHTLGVALLFGGFFAAALWELWRPRRELDDPPGPRWLANLALYCLNGALFVWIFPATAVATAGLEARLGLRLPHWPPAWTIANFAAAFLFLDFFRYLMHRVFHRVPWLWRLHALHHADSDLDVTTSFRHHPVEFAVGSALFWAALVVTAFPADIAAAYLFVASALTCFQHANISLPARWERVLQAIVVTPDMHRLHHSVRADEANSNFGFMFSFWDRLLGTHCALCRSGHAGLRFGLCGIRNPGLAAMLMLPWRMRQAAPE